MTRRKLDKSKELLARAENVIPRAAQTLSKAPDQFVRGVSPYAIERGDGCRVWDVDGNEYIDLSSSLGPIILGHRHPITENAIADQREKGSIFTLPGELEVVLAEKIKETVPFAEMIRFGMNGSDATTAAVRIARAYTGRDHIAKCGYHGWADWSIATHPMRSKGIPQAVKDLTHEFKFNDIESLKKIFDDHPGQIAAVTMEVTHGTAPDEVFLKGVRELTEKNNTVLVFDEIVTGFRLALGGAAVYFGVTPDIVCYGKSLSNGEPLSIVAGKKEIMSVLDGQDVFFSFTYAGYLPALAASIAVLDFMKSSDFFERIWQSGEMLAKIYRELIDKYQIPATITGLGPLVGIVFKGKDQEEELVLKSLFLQETAKNGLLTNCSHMINYSHDASIIKEVGRRLEKVFEAMHKVISENRIKDSLEGPMVRPRNKPQ